MESEVKADSSPSTADSMEHSISRETGTIAGSLSAMFNNQELCDVRFRFPNEEGEEKQTTQAHKLILAIRSPVFKAMFYGTLQETGPDVNIEDISYDIFQSLLRYTCIISVYGLLLSASYESHEGTWRLKKPQHFDMCNSLGIRSNR